MSFRQLSESCLPRPQRHEHAQRGRYPGWLSAATCRPLASKLSERLSPAAASRPRYCHFCRRFSAVLSSPSLVSVFAPFSSSSFTTRDSHWWPHTSAPCGRSRLGFDVGALRSSSLTTSVLPIARVDQRRAASFSLASMLAPLSAIAAPLLCRPFRRLGSVGHSGWSRPGPPLDDSTTKPWLKKRCLPELFHRFLLGEDANNPIEIQ